MSLRLRKLVAVTALLGAVTGAACKPKSPPATTDDDTTLAQDGVDTAAAETDAQLLTSTLVSATGAGGLALASASDLSGGELAPSDVGDGAKAFFFPRGCLTTAHDAAARTVTYTFGGCIGPNGLARIAGVVTARYAVAPGSLTLDLTATDLRINRATVDWSARAVVSATGAQRSMTWKGQLSGKTARGRDLARSAETSVRWQVGEPCIAVDGTAQGDVGGRGVRTEVKAYARCRGECPEAGGSIKVTSLANDRSLELSFDGTNKATLRASTGRTATVTMLCGGG